MKFNMLKKILLTGGVLGCLVAPLINTAPVAAADDCRYMLGLTSWDCGSGYESVNSEEDLKNTAVIIAFNILTDLTVLAGYLVVGWIIWGGYKYMFSRGDVSKVTEGKKTLTNAFIGLAIVMLSGVIFSAIRSVLGSGSLQCVVPEGVVANATCSNGMLLPKTDVDQIVVNTIEWFLGMSGVVAVIFMVYGGISYITAAGDAGKIVKAKNSILYALIGLIIVAISLIITNFVTNAIKDAATTTAMMNNQITPLMEELYENKII